MQYNNLKDDILWDLRKVVEDMVNRRLKLNGLKKIAGINWKLYFGLLRSNKDFK